MITGIVIEKTDYKMELY